MIYVLAFFLALLAACNGDDSYMYHSYCESNVCKESTEVRQRPTSFALELRLNDTAESRVARLLTLDCAYLPDEDSTQYSTFCVDSLKYGDSDSLLNLPQKSKYNYDYYYTYSSVQNNGTLLQMYAKIPIDDDDHLRFTLVDRENKKKAFDIDLSAYLNMYELHGDTFSFKFPKQTEFYAYTRDTTFSEKDCSAPFQKTISYECYNYSVDDPVISDTSIYCIVGEGDHYENITGAITNAEFFAVSLEDIGDSSACKSQRFHEHIQEWTPMHTESVRCNNIKLDETPDTVSISNLYSRRLMNDVILDSLGVRLHRWSSDQPDSELVTGNRYTWHTVNHLEKQGPDGEDDFTIYTIHRDVE